MAYTYKAYAIDYDSQDYLISKGSFSYIYDLEVIRQNLWQALQINQTEWFLNLDEGIQYITGNDDGFFGSVNQDYLIEDAIKKAAIEVEGVTGIISFSLKNNSETLQIALTVSTIFSEEISLSITV